ncbi:site-2 protease family protein [Candidatus Kaiserbacteria bacterium CG10_big_fil_rev_8_21_14_0_10_45_20]|uniref:Site-2 protease family protein n=1 Tax=Candidatus Kaiserbacteria bacterium CG10_big_fil_rev_8_21_14_0_10_45_20 TaxID=1974607 RepID=A0A2H0UFF8_9BACT|nr:MAG: site-2 protease family protein [Candidatus Kaiserbacteria bacterium CG10_big_fil_rev_8_21_14_0_10_45_20]
MEPTIFVPVIVLVIFSIILHEVAHGFVAHLLGDPTARLAGRLTLNPIPHLDPIGSILLPGILALSQTPFLIGWAKPVPYNPYNFKNQRWGEALVSAAGPATNILIAVVIAMAMRFGMLTNPELFQIGAFVILANIVLAIINLIPIPPLDGSKILRSLLPYSMNSFFVRIETLTYALGPFGLIAALLLIVYVFNDIIFAFVRAIFSLLTGMAL